MTGHALVTGAAGFIGSHLCERLVSDGWLVTGIDSLSPTYDTARRRKFVNELGQERAFRFIEGDLLRIDLGDLLHDVDVVFHLAARPGVRSSWEDFERALDANVMATKKLLYAIVRSDASPRLLFASSSSVYGTASSFPTQEDELLRPISPYGVTKASAEQLVSAYISQYGLVATTLRYFTVYGPRQRPDMAFARWIDAALSGRALYIFGDGSSVRDFTYVSDVVDATVSALDAPAGTYNIAGGSPSSISDAIDAIAELTEAELDLRYRPGVKGDPSRTGGDTAAFRHAVGWQPEVSLTEGLASQVAWSRES